MSGMNKTHKRSIIILELSISIIIYWLITWVLVPNILISVASLSATLIILASATFYYLYISPTYIHEDTLESRGLGSQRNFVLLTDNFIYVWKIVFIPLLIICGAILFAAWQKNASFFVKPDWYALLLKFFFYLFSAFAQDIFFFSFLLIRLKEIITLKSNIFKQVTVVFIFALFFALFHLPNVPLMILTFVFAFYLGYIFYETPNLYIVVIVHALLGTLLHRVYELDIKIGVYYGTEGHIFRFIIPMINDLIGGRW